MAGLGLTDMLPFGLVKSFRQNLAERRADLPGVASEELSGAVGNIIGRQVGSALKSTMAGRTKELEQRIQERFGTASESENIVEEKIEP